MIENSFNVKKEITVLLNSDPQKKKLLHPKSIPMSQCYNCTLIFNNFEMFRMKIFELKLFGTEFLVKADNLDTRLSCTTSVPPFSAAVCQSRPNHIHHNIINVKIEEYIRI